MKTVDFELKDADGVAHRYEVQLFTSNENVRLQLLIAGPLFGLVGQLARSLVPALGEGKLSDIIGSTDKIAAALQRIDWNTLPGALAALPAAIEEKGGPVLVERVFARTTRLVPIPEAQGAPTIDEGVDKSNMRQELRSADWRDVAFGDGNFAELWQAFGMVLIVNFTRYGRSGSGDWKSAVASATGGLLKVSTPTVETTQPSSASSSASSSPPS